MGELLKNTFQIKYYKRISYLKLIVHKKFKSVIARLKCPLSSKVKMSGFHVVVNSSSFSA